MLRWIIVFLIGVITAIASAGACPGDATGNDVVDVDDLLETLNQFGLPGGGSADFDGDGDLDLYVAHFGELALLDNSPRAATVTALTGVSLLVLARDDFTRILGPMVRSQPLPLTRRISHRLCIAHVLPFSEKFLREQTVR